MSRLVYRGDTIDTFGRFLPTPIIETIKLDSIESSDSILDPLNELLSTKSDMSTVSATDVTKLTIRTSALFNSDDTFNSTELFEEIFEILGVGIGFSMVVSQFFTPGLTIWTKH